MLSAAERTLRSQIAAHTLHAKYDSAELTKPARDAADAALNRRLLEEIDPDGLLPEEERARRLRHARKAHFARIKFEALRKRRDQSIPAVSENDHAT